MNDSTLRSDSAMRSVEAGACGKVILYGEHSVVYGRPAIAVPVSGLRVHATLAPLARGAGLHIVATDLGEAFAMNDAGTDDPLATIARLTLAHCNRTEPDAELTIHSDLPIAAGLGSGAAVSVAIVRALARFLECPLSREATSALAYEVEKIHHGAPSGIDNTVIAYEQPVYFVRGQSPQTFAIGAPFDLVIANSGIAGMTRDAVAGVRARWRAGLARYEAWFDRMGRIAEEARVAIEAGEHAALGALMDENHALLQKIGVSLPELDTLVHSAREAGALGAKLTGSGMGGNVIALATPQTAAGVAGALEAAGAAQVWQTQAGD
ncbi:MAG: mevalonate kinase [Anaerolineae bacterium]|nr:mevalonate kinase [Anaerolineae bacterium]